MADCKCFHPLYLDIDGTRGSYEPCNLDEVATKLCISNVMDQFTTGVRSCPCNQSCFETEYASSVSSAMWPAKQYEVMIDLSSVRTRVITFQFRVC